MLFSYFSLSLSAAFVFLFAFYFAPHYPVAGQSIRGGVIRTLLSERLQRLWLVKAMKHRYMLMDYNPAVNREENCDVTWPWSQNFWMTTIGSLSTDSGDGNDWRLRDSNELVRTFILTARFRARSSEGRGIFWDYLSFWRGICVISTSAQSSFSLSFCYAKFLFR